MSPTQRDSEHQAAAPAAERTAPRGVRDVFLAILHMRCPRCHRGHLFRGLFAMNDPCPVCRLLIQREEGYFLGAMYISYALASVIIAAAYFTTAALFPTWPGLLLVLVACLVYLPLVPIVFRYSRVLWIYFDRAADPRGGLAGRYEKMRLREQREGERTE
jgi:uncharacterized protein (DUF983 family)